MANLDEILRQAFQAFRPPAKAALSVWLEQTVCLPQSQATPGPLILWGFQKEPADSIGAPSVERISILKSSRVGFSTLLASAIAYLIARDPCAIALLMPTEADSRGIMVDDLEPLFDGSPALRGLLRPPTRQPTERSTILSRQFPGGSLKIIASRAPRNLRRHSVKVLFCDEVDGYEPSAEGDVLALAEKRTLSFSPRKIVCGSTPIDESTSSILRLYNASDQRVYEIECPHCRAWFEILWRHIRWPENDPGRAHCVCPMCEAVIEEQQKNALVERGRWRATKPEVENHHGYKLNALISPLPNAAWGKLAEEFLQARHDPNRLKAFTCTLLGEAWRADENDGPDEGELVSRCEDISLEKIPEAIALLTCGCDVQDDRFEISTLGFDKAGTIYVLEHAVIYGRPQDAADEAWADLDDHLRRKFQHPRGGTLKIDSAVVDAGDGDTFRQVVDFCSTRHARRIFAGRGVAGFQRPPLTLSKAKRGRLYLIGVDPLKSRILGLISSPAKLIRFSSALASTDYFSQLTSERKVTRVSRGRPVIRFERRPGARSESLDCLTYGLAARSALTLDLSRRESELASPAQPPPPKRPEVIRSTFMAR